MRIVCVCGMLDISGSDRRMWNRWKDSFLKVFPKSECVVTRCLYMPWQRDAMATYAASLLKQYDDGTPTVLFGYSLGGVIARSIATRFKKTAILLVVTLNAPHRLHNLFGFPYDYHPYLRVVAFGGVTDWLVPHGWARCYKATNITLKSGHYFTLLRSAEVRSQVVSHVKQMLCGPR